MAQRKRSIGITIFAWFFIITSFIALVFGIPYNQYTESYPFLSKIILICLSFYFTTLSIIYIIAGINLLRLKEWSRKLIIALQIVVLMMSIFVFYPLSHRPEAKAQLKITVGKVWERMSKDRKLKYASKAEYITDQVQRVNSMQPLSRVMSFLYCGLILLFFTRSKIKEQFRK